MKLDVTTFHQRTVLLTWIANMAAQRNGKLCINDQIGMKRAVTLLIKKICHKEDFSEMYLKNLVLFTGVYVQFEDCICKNCKLCLSNFLIVFVKILNCICQNSQFWAVRQESSFIFRQAQVSTADTSLKWSIPVAK